MRKLDNYESVRNGVRINLDDDITQLLLLYLVKPNINLK